MRHNLYAKKKSARFSSCLQKHSTTIIFWRYHIRVEGWNVGGTYMLISGFTGGMACLDEHECSRCSWSSKLAALLKHDGAGSVTPHGSFMSRSCGRRSLWVTAQWDQQSSLWKDRVPQASVLHQLLPVTSLINWSITRPICQLKDEMVFLHVSRDVHSIHPITKHEAFRN